MIQRHRYTCPIGDKSRVGYNILGFTQFQDAFSFLTGWYHEKLDEIVLITEYGEDTIDWISIPKKHYNKNISESIIKEFNSRCKNNIS